METYNANVLGRLNILPENFISLFFFLNIDVRRNRLIKY